MTWGVDIHGEGYEYYLWSKTDSSIEANRLSGFSVQIYSALDNKNNAEPACNGATGETRLDGILQVGTSALFPEGSMLPLIAQAGFSGAAWYEYGFQAEIWRGKSLIGQLDLSQRTSELDVYAGESLRLATYHWSQNVAESGGYGTRMNLTLEVIPEPATLLLLSLGAVMLRHRKRV